ncbi:MAG: nucleoside triphosphate pyrophosphohydrolase [Spirochaetota bacterium]|nr:nucleoside triphosphate pyrophosphohydrolase [Spirochaetota bacterium]
MKQFNELVDVIKKLRAPDGCQWDKEQSLDSIKPYLLEECHEVLESIVDKNYKDLQEELGDLLCQIVFLSQIASEDEQFTIDQVIDGITQKLIRRHPHVFGEVKTNDTQEILKNWEKIKRDEKKHRESVLDGIPKTLPALTKAFKVQDKASRVGFDWKDVRGPIAKVEEELGEFIEVLKLKDDRDQDKLNDEFGDLLFSLVNTARHLSIDPEFALQKSINKFFSRFRYVEKRLSLEEKSPDELSLEELDKLWDEAKLELAAKA